MRIWRHPLEEYVIWRKKRTRLWWRLKSPRMIVALGWYRRWRDALEVISQFLKGKI